MRIVYKGTPKRIFWKGECRECESRMEADANELQVSYDPRDGSSVGQAMCPACGNCQVFFYKSRE